MKQEQLIKAIKSVSESPYPSAHHPDPVDSAVLILMHGEPGQLEVLLTKRSEQLSAHPGQISFPGGRFDDGDETLENTALRETEEEIGINRTDITLLGELTPVVTLTGFRIVPFIGYINILPELTIQESEVDSAFSVPLTWLIDEQNVSQISREILGQLMTTFILEWQEHIIWGATANMIADLGYRIRHSNQLNQIK